GVGFHRRAVRPRLGVAALPFPSHNRLRHLAPL
ncbi:MAG: hypothetical protein AVDCRST_MAG44-1269, partial [uncultured Sphingomonas sp.]